MENGAGRKKERTRNTAAAAMMADGGGVLNGTMPPTITIAANPLSCLYIHIPNDVFVRPLSQQTTKERTFEYSKSQKTNKTKRPKRES